MRMLDSILIVYLCVSAKVTHPDQLCKGYPSEFRDYFAHCLSLGFEDRPDYRWVRATYNLSFE